MWTKIMSGADYERRVREKAFELWKQAGQPFGDDQKYWYQALQILDIGVVESFMPTWIALTSTFIKATVESAATLPAEQKIYVKSGQMVSGVPGDMKSNHLPIGKLTINGKLQTKNVSWIFLPHWKKM
jgi:hypothetical protein